MRGRPKRGGGGGLCHGRYTFFRWLTGQRRRRDCSRATASPSYPTCAARERRGDLFLLSLAPRHADAASEAADCPGSRVVAANCRSHPNLPSPRLPLLDLPLTRRLVPFPLAHHSATRRSRPTTTNSHDVRQRSRRAKDRAGQAHRRLLKGSSTGHYLISLFAALAGRRNVGRLRASEKPGKRLSGRLHSRQRLAREAEGWLGRFCKEANIARAGGRSNWSAPS